MTKRSLLSIYFDKNVITLRPYHLFIRLNFVPSNHLTSQTVRLLFSVHRYFFILTISYFTLSFRNLGCQTCHTLRSSSLFVIFHICHSSSLSFYLLFVIFLTFPSFKSSFWLVIFALDVGHHSYSGSTIYILTLTSKLQLLCLHPYALVISLWHIDIQ